VTLERDPDHVSRPQRGLAYAVGDVQGGRNSLSYTHSNQR
jgi:hypothetical protein